MNTASMTSIALAAAVAPAFGATYLGTFGDSEYFISTAVTAMDARVEALELGGSLATINSVEEEAWILEQIGDQMLFIGLNDELDEGVYVWDSGEEAGYVNFAPGEPNNSFAGEDSVIINWNDLGQWNDMAGHAGYHGLIERTIPAPGAAAVFAALGLGAARRRR